MSDTLIALFFAAGVGGFTYSKMSRRVGYGNNRPAIIITAVAAIIAFVFLYTFFSLVLNIH